MSEGAVSYALTKFVCLVVALAGAMAATPASTSIPKHVLTWAFDGSNGAMTDGTTPSSTNPTSKRHVQTWVSFAEAGNAVGKPQKAYYDCGASGAPCKFVIYYDPSGLFADCWPDKAFLSQNTTEDYYLHDGAPPSQSNRTTLTRLGCGNVPTTLYYVNMSNPAVGQWFARIDLWTLPKNSNTIMFQDASDADCRNFFHPGHHFAPYEVQSGSSSCEATLGAALRTVASQMRWKDGTPVPVIINGLAPVSQYEAAHTATIPVLAPGSNIIGGQAEAPEIHGTSYTPRMAFGAVNTASLVYATDPAALYLYSGTLRSVVGSSQPCRDSSYNYEVDCGQSVQRRNMLATFWLAYNEGHEILWEYTATHRVRNPSEHLLDVLPEASIVPTQPIQVLTTFDTNRPTTDGSGCGPEPGEGGIQSFVVACGTLNDEETPAGIYVREFRRCYNFGELIGDGHCAVVKNTTNRSVVLATKWFMQDYTHLMVLGTGPVDGADVLTAGCGDAQCPKTAINPLGAPFEVGKTEVPAFDAIFLFHH